MAQTREQARQAERRRQERRAIRQAQESQQRKVRSIIGAVVAIVLVIGAVVAIGLFKSDNTPSPGAASQPTGSPSTDPTAADPSASPSAPTTPTEVACGATAPTPGPEQQFATEPAMTIDQKAKYVATIKTSCGTLTVDMDAAKAPHTVNTWAFLAGKKYWDGTRCHRMTKDGSLDMLQCGDPTGTGQGGPGFTIAEENLTGATYTKGTIAMAKTSAPHSTGSQFFIVFGDSQLSPDYTVVGHVTADTMAVLDKIAAVGVVPSDMDTQPAKLIYLDSVTVKKA
ncbi:MAG: peptidylprolyl isomerase [Frankiales bacterium]|nr:peptidylprolyl isomerase [Frankiales bacterium]